MSKVAIIGSNGLLSDHAAQYCIENGYDIEIFGLEKPKKSDLIFHKVDLLTQKLNFEYLASFDVVIYASGAGIQSNLNENNNIIYSLNTFVPIDICDNLSRIDYRGVFVTFGSYFEVGSNVENKRYSEQEVSNSQYEVPNAYCISKRLLTRYVNSSRPSFKHLHLILSTIYGPTEAPHRLIPYTVNAINNGELPSFTTGNQVRQYVFIDDIPPILFKLAREVKKNEIVNISGTQTYTVKELVEKIFEVKGKQIDDTIFGKTERADIGMINLQIDDSKLRHIIGEVIYTPFCDVLKLYK